MPNATKQYTREELWKLYDKLPQELKDAVFSEETADHNWNACERNQVPEEKVSQVASQVGNVLMGLTLPKDFQSALQKEVGLKPTVAQAVAQEISRFVFYPVKAQLEQLHQVPGEAAQQQEKKDLGVATPRHSDRDDYVVREEPAESPEGIQVGPPQSSEAGLGGEDPYREKAE